VPASQSAASADGAEVSVRVALTIDTELAGHPCDPDNPRRLLDALAAHRAPATFFVQGRWATAHPGLLRRIAADGHLIGNHSHWHAPLHLMTDEGITASIAMAEEAIRELSGVDPRPWFRCPYGQGSDDVRVQAALAGCGYRHVGWHVDAGDWPDGRTPDDVVSEVLEGCRRTGDGAIVLLHSWPKVAAAALPLVISGLREAGITLVRLDELGGRAGRELP
jgi:peptidoglycan/xylan/chitin deacetylase (PgdA/CDA1 family)